MASKLEIDSLTIRNSGNIFSSTLDGNVGDFVWSGSYLYICVAENSWKRVAVASWSAPDQVTGLTVDDVGDTTIDLSWNAPSSDDPITDYIIEYTTGQNTLTVFVGSNTTSYQLTNLVTDSEYSIRVAAISSAGTGTYSVTITETPGLFDPASITGLQAWWDASDTSTITESSGSVSQVDDKSGNDYHLTQSTGASQPSLVSAAQNGLSVLRFDGSDDFLSVPSSTAEFKFLHATDSTVFFVCKATGSEVNGAVLSSSAPGGVGPVGANYSYESRTDLATYPFVRVTHPSNTAPDYVSVLTNSGPGWESGSFILASAVVNPAEAVAADRLDLRVNGGTLFTPNIRSSTASTGNSTYDLRIGSFGNGTGFLNGDICEILTYNSALSDTDREAVENYLMTKWGITP